MRAGFGPFALAPRYRPMRDFARKIIALPILGMLGLSGCGEGTEVDAASVYKQRIEQAVAASQRVAASPEEERLDQALYEIGRDFDGHLGIAVIDIDRGRTVHYGGREIFPQQSVSKLWVALTALQMVDSGDLSLDEMASVTYGDLTVFHQPIRNTVRARGAWHGTYGELLRRAITQSDNTANDKLLRRVGGPDAVRAAIVRNRLGAIRFGPGERAMQSAIAGLEWRQAYAEGRRFYEARDEVPHPQRKAAFDAYVTDPVDGATPVAVAKALARLSRGELLEEDTTQLFLDLLGEVRSGPNRLKGGLPQGWSIGHKTGTGQVLVAADNPHRGEQAGFNDVGILTAPDGSRYAVAVMVGRTGVALRDRMAMMHRVVAAIERYHREASGEGGDEGAGDNAA